MNMSNDNIVTIIGRGHSGTRMIAGALKNSGFYMGDVNVSNDKKPYAPIYELSKIVLSQYISISDNYEVDISKMYEDVPDFAVKKINYYLNDVFSSKNKNKGWKLPETVFIYPWLVQMYPQIKYILWFRNPKANKHHNSDDFLRDWRIMNCESLSSINLMDISWKIQYDIITKTHANNTIFVKYEDYVLNHNNEIKRISDFLNFSLNKHSVIKNKAQYPNREVPNFLKKPMRNLGYQ